MDAAELGEVLRRDQPFGANGEGEMCSWTRSLTTTLPLTHSPALSLSYSLTHQRTRPGPMHPRAEAPGCTPAPSSAAGPLPPARRPRRLAGLIASAPRRPCQSCRTAASAAAAPAPGSPSDDAVVMFSYPRAERT
eukprot:scaffold7072_cov267-Pinguiococcus_pyrenoidosus.AAC.8